MSAAAAVNGAAGVVSPTEFARLMGKTRQWAHKVVMPKLSPAARTSDGKIVIAPAIRELQLKVDLGKSRSPGPLELALAPASAEPADGAESIVDARARRERAQADLAELELQRRRKELVEAAGVGHFGEELAAFLKRALETRRERCVVEARQAETVAEALRAQAQLDRQLCAELGGEALKAGQALLAEAART